MKKMIFLIFTVIFSYAKTEFEIFSLKLNYKEYINGKIVDRDYSKFNDILGIGINFYKSGFFDYYLKGNFAKGSSIYKGINWNKEKIKAKQNGFYLIDLEVGFGKYFYFLGGYRWWNRGESKRDGDYNEIYYWPYLGFKYRYSFNLDNFSFVPEVGYKIAINPKLKIELTNKPVLELGNTTGKFVQLPFYFKYKNVMFKIFYKYDYWNIEKSKMDKILINNKEYPIFEPESKTKNHYLGAGIIFNF